MTNNEIKNKTDISHMLAYINASLPEIMAGAHMFRQNSQSSLSFQTLTMLNGQSPLRMLRQCTAEISTRRNALLESCTRIEKLELRIASATGSNKRVLQYQLVELQNAIVNSMKDIAVLTTRYEQIMHKNGMENWTESDFERAEAAHHVRRGFELLYQNLIQQGRPEKSTIEYLQAYGIHPQVANREVAGYIALTEQNIQAGARPASDDLENFFDAMRDKYQSHPVAVSQRMFGTDGLVLEDCIVPTIEHPGAAHLSFGFSAQDPPPPPLRMATHHRANELT